MKSIFKIIFSIFLSFSYSQSIAVQVVRIQIDYSNTPHTLDLELFDDVVGPSVSNFLTYVNDGRYERTFITRSIPNFILQSGSYTFRPIDPLTEILSSISPTSALQLVPTDASILNDFNLSNVRGTVAFAKFSSDPDSATSGWFINLDDNSENLDNQNGGFTVFGSVIDDGMDIADEMATFPIQTFVAGVLGSDFANFPVVDYDFLTFPLSGIFQSNMIMLTSFTVISRPIIRLTPSSINYELDIAGDAAEKTVITTLKNTGDEILDIGVINGLSAPYSIKSDGCSNVTLDPQNTNVNSTCDIELAFSPSTVGVFDGTLTVPYTSAVNAAMYSVTYHLTGEGVPFNPVTNTSTADIIYDDLAIISTFDETVTIRNKGGSTLIISAINITGTDITQFTVDNAGCVAGSMLNTNETCSLIVSFAPTTAGTKSASVEILSNASTSTISLSGTATEPELSVQSSLNLLTSAGQIVSEIFSATNIGTGNLIFSDVTISGPDAGFFTQQNRCPDTNNSIVSTQELGPGGSCDIFVEFTPTDGLPRAATFTITSNDPINPIFTIDLTATIEDSFITVPNDFDLGTTEIGGTPSTRNLIITNTGIAPLVISNITGLTGTDFAQINNCIGLGIQLATNETCNVSITYTPSVAGTTNETLIITSNDPANTIKNINVSGFGVDTTVTDPLISTASSLDLGTTEIGGIPSTQDIIVTNRGLAPLIISNISSFSNIDFSQVNDCIGAGIQLPLDTSCSITVSYTPSSIGAIVDTLTITSNDPANPSINININGNGVDNVIEDPFISVIDIFDTGTAQVNGIASTRELIITNKGLAPLKINDIFGLTNTDFTTLTNCLGTGINLALDSSCSVLITHTPTTLGSATDTLTITSDDPLKPSIEITINGFGDKDTDGVVSNVELAGPNSGDGNNDGILDEIQNNVASLIAENSNYITFISDDSVMLGSETFMIGVELIDNTPAEKPASSSFDYGLFSYAIRLPSGDGTNLAILLPKNENPTTFYIYGPTASNTTNHWYNFSYDNATKTGAQFLGEVSFTSPSGSILNKNLVIVSYKDGLRGDDDLQINGTILNKTSGLSLSKSTSTSSSGSGTQLYLPVCLLLIIRLFRNIQMNKQYIC